ncbi:SDR family NAD(P)-dependent oxidoreductase [Cupriavidus sp. P-10]|uniref:SDR family NAD(P)-dependent oxidoreductase n=1 Tax=Cupriavidus sp. P-10 TaxID=2027911 RepID=UPI000E2EA7D6|nr:SDR family NAD(P)-dependent oxidoreductase [Cupriavidus sp. P-10]BDB27236.1 SDR family NAD(P)-dependent oxidoreductase [Cupriavidus sp. P-10]
MHQAIQKNAVAIVTGGAAGIGYAIARRLVAEEMRVVVFDKDEAALNAAVTELLEQSPLRTVYGVVGDVSSPSSRQTLLKKSLNRGDIALLVNNAGSLKGSGPWENIEQWRQTMEVNFWSIVELQALFVEHLLKQESCSAIVNVGSKEGITTPPGNAAYNVSKAALRVLTEQLAHELRTRAGEKVTAHLLVPGYTFTSMNFPGMASASPKPRGTWTADQVAERMLERLNAGDFYLYCQDEEVTWETDRRRLQWSVDDIIKNRPALSRWHPNYQAEFRAYVGGGQIKDQ